MTACGTTSDNESEQVSEWVQRLSATIEYSESNENNERVQPVATNERK